MKEGKIPQKEVAEIRNLCFSALKGISSPSESKKAQTALLQLADDSERAFLIQKYLVGFLKKPVSKVSLNRALAFITKAAEKKPELLNEAILSCALDRFVSCQERYVKAIFRFVLESASPLPAQNVLLNELQNSEKTRRDRAKVILDGADVKCLAKPDFVSSLEGIAVNGLFPNQARACLGRIVTAPEVEWSFPAPSEPQKKQRAVRPFANDVKGEQRPPSVNLSAYPQVG